MAAADRDGWQDCVEALCATWHEEDRYMCPKDFCPGL